jgi:hypothetical protein
MFLKASQSSESRPPGTGRVRYTSKTTMIALAVALAMVVGALFAPTPAAADCMAPTITIDDGPLIRGSTLRVVGTAWGDDCHDTGPPPEGEDTLGKPLNEIDVVVVQGDEEYLVAEGAAGARYDFAVNVAVPSDLVPGAEELVARSTAGSVNVNATVPLIIASDAPIDAHNEVAQFGAPASSVLPSAGTPAASSSPPPTSTANRLSPSSSALTAATSPANAADGSAGGGQHGRWSQSPSWSASRQYSSSCDAEMSCRGRLHLGRLRSCLDGTDTSRWRWASRRVGRPPDGTRSQPRAERAAIEQAALER